MPSTPPETTVTRGTTPPRRQFIVNLDADVEVEVGGGEKKVIRRGEVFFVEDTTGRLEWMIGGSSYIFLFCVNTGACMSIRYTVLQFKATIMNIQYHVTR